MNKEFKTHTFDRRNEFTISDMRRALQQQLPNNTTVTCIKCKRVISKEQLDAPCDEGGK